MLKKLSQIEYMLMVSEKKSRLGIVVAQDEHTIEAIWKAVENKYVEPVLFGKEKLIKPIWQRVAGMKTLPEIVECENNQACIEAALRMVHDGKLDCIMKGRLETGELMKGIVNRETGIKKSGALSLIAIMESPEYHKLFAISDVGLMTYPNLEQKVSIINNAVELFHAIGIENPKVGVLAAVENVNPKMPETVDADIIKKMNQTGELKGCIVEGPISYDLCMDSSAAIIKEYKSPVAGDPDILIVPDIVSGNLLSKSLLVNGNSKTCGTVWGAMVPIVITSRSASAEDKYMSIVLSALVGRQEN